MTIITYTGSFKYIPAIFWSQEQKLISRGGNQPSLPLTLAADPTPIPGQGSKKFYVKMTEKDDPTNQLQSLMVQLSVLAGWKINLIKGVITLVIPLFSIGRDRSISPSPHNLRLLVYSRGYCTPRPRFVSFCVFLCHREENIFFMHGSDRNMIRSKKMICILLDLRISRADWFKLMFSFLTLKIL